MSGGGGSTQTVQKADPWGGQQPYLKDIFTNAQNVYHNQTPQYYPGQTVAGFTPTQVQGQQMALGAANNLQPTLNSATQGINFANNPSILSPDTNPYLAKTADAAAQQVTRTLNEQLLPSIQDQAVSAGNIGNDREGIARGIATRGATDAIANNTFNLYNNAYSQGLDTLTKGLALTPSLAQATTLPSSIYSSVGGEQQAQNQADINSNIDRWNYNQGIPWQELSNYMSIINGNFGGTSTTTQGSKQAPLTSALQTGLGLYGLGNAALDTTAGAWALAMMSGGF